MRLDESLYNVRSFINTSAPIREVGGSDRLSLPSTPHNGMKALTLTTTEIVKKDVVTHGIFSNMCFCIDMDSSNEFQRKVISRFLLTSNMMLSPVTQLCHEDSIS